MKTHLALLAHLWIMLTSKWWVGIIINNNVLGCSQPTSTDHHTRAPQVRRTDDNRITMQRRFGELRRGQPQAAEDRYGFARTLKPNLKVHGGEQRTAVKEEYLIDCSDTQPSGRLAPFPRQTPRRPGTKSGLSESRALSIAAEATTKTSFAHAGGKGRLHTDDVAAWFLTLELMSWKRVCAA